MKTLIVGAAVALAASAAFAQEIIPYQDSFVSSMTRADVRAEAASTLGAGTQGTQGEITWVPAVSRNTSANGSELRAEGRQAERTEMSNTVFDMSYHN